MRPHEPEPGHLYHLERLRGNLVFVKVVILVYEFFIVDFNYDLFFKEIGRVRKRRRTKNSCWRV